MRRFEAIASRPAARIEHIAMLLVPGSVVNLGDDRLDKFAARVETVVKTDRIHQKSAVTKMGEQPYRTRRPKAQTRSDQITHRLLERLSWIAQMVSPPKSG